MLNKELHVLLPVHSVAAGIQQQQAVPSWHCDSCCRTRSRAQALRLVWLLKRRRFQLYAACSMRGGCRGHMAAAGCTLHMDVPYSGGCSVAETVVAGS